ELKSLRNDHQSQLGAMQKRHDDELARIRQDAASQKQTLESRIGDMETTHRTELQDLRREHDTATSAMESRHAEELKRIRQEAATEKQSLEARLAESEKAHRAEVQQLRAEHDAVRNELQKRHENELSRVRQEAASAREALETQLAETQRQHEDELQSLRSEYESVIDDAETVHAEELRLANAETDKVRQDFESRLSHAHTKAEALKTTIADMESRASEERRNWESRLDQLHRTDQEERTRERERHDAIAARQQEELTSLQERNADVQAKLDDIERVAAEHAASLRTAQATLQERDETLQTERRSREELVASHKETLSVLQARLDTANKELTEYQERADSLRRELERVQQAASERQAVLIGERDELNSQIARLEDDLENERTTAETHKQRLDRELESFKLMLVEREKQLSSWRDAHREACAEARTFEERAATLEDEMTKTTEEARETIAAETQRRTELEDELAALHRERTDLEERRQRELVEERLDHRRKLHKVEFEMATLRERLQRALAVSDPRGRVETLVRCIAERVPSAQIYVWRREPDGSARMIGWMNDERELFDGQNLPPWTFERETIPAEGITELTDAAELAARIHNHPQQHHDVWLGHWSPNAQPLWSIVWPWQGRGRGTLGWVTVFGFDTQAPAGETIDEVDTWVGLVGATVDSIGDAQLAAPVTPSEVSNPDDGIQAEEPEQFENIAEIHEAHDTSEMYGSDEEGEPSEISEPEAVEESVEEPVPATDEHTEDKSEPVDEAPVERRWIDLHNVILNWAAHQTEDALRLDLTAQPSITVDEHWLRDTLEHGRQSCRGAESLGGEFIVSTLRQNGHTVVRLVRGGEQTEPEHDNVAAVEDTELITETASPGDAPEDNEHDSPVSGRWLVRDGNRIGMELRFSHTLMDDDQRAEVENQQVTGHVRTVLVADDDNAMVELLTGMIDSLGNDALTASNRDVAQEQLRVQDVDVVIINAGMGGGTGWNVARWFKDANPQLPVVLVVGAETMSVPDDFPGDWMLRLPFQIDELRECLDALTTVQA
ncbi:MAG: response regulator, partial [candidate division Zixibacteria bacterium]|nr:response regulator [candidate division Zixibacteria bacterium]